MKITSSLFVFTILYGVSGNSQEQPLIAEGAKLELLSEDFEFTEGPATDEAGNVYFTDQPNNKIHKWNAEDEELSVFMEDSGRANGLY
ncbi:MAG: SMP-30/gluconolactonase/LRE family protein, partial [Salinimicrobium sp.]